MISVVFPLFFFALANLYYFLFFKKSIKKNVWWLLLIAIFGSLLLSISMSNSNYGSTDDIFSNFLFMFAVVSVYAVFLLGLHHLVINKKIILIESYSAYIVFFLLLFMFATFIYITSVALIIGTGS